MLFKVFTQDKKGYMETYNNVYKFNIYKIARKSYLVLKTNEGDIKLPLADFDLVFAVDNINLVEYFRYTK